MDKGIWQPDCPVPLDRLKAVNVTFHTFDGAENTGQIVVLDVIAPLVQAVFEQLYAHKFPLTSVQPMEAFDGDDDASMAVNNSSGFFSRRTTDQTRWSMHAYGLAIDINPIQNPYVLRQEGAVSQLLPPEGEDYLDRNEDFAGKTEEIASILKTNGFNVWGGNFADDLKDYHHFQVPRPAVHQLLALEANETSEALRILNGYVSHNPADLR